MGWKTGKGTNRSHRAPHQASSYQGAHGLIPGLSRLWAKPWVSGSHSPIGWTSTERLGSCPTSSTKPAAPSASSQGHSLHATSFQNLQGTCTPPEASRPRSGCPVACPCQVWPGTGFLRNPGPKQPEPRPRVGSRTGCGRSSSSSEARPHGDYNGSLLCLGHFKVKFSSMNVQPVSLAQG